MLLAFLSVLGGLVLLVLGAEGLVRGSAALALRLGITPLVVGLIIVAFGTSSPELMVSVKASLYGTGDIAVGGVIGSNISNIALILGLTAIIRPIQIQSQVIKREMPILIIVSFVFWAMLYDGKLSRLDGGLLFTGMILYIGFSFYLMRKGQSKMPEELIAEAKTPKVQKIWQDLVFIVLGLGLLVIGAQFMVEGAVHVAEDLGISKAVIALTVVALGTSLPELATSVVAAVKKQDDLSIGNVVGSNIFNMCSVLGIAALIYPIHAPDISNIDLAVMVGFTLLIVPLLYTNFTLHRWEGILLVAGYAAYIIYLLP